ncbi:MAG: hypothetical protein V1744_05095 [Candidatus Altiarchaeota archaeon]
MEDKMTWCVKQKRGIELIEPNENLAKAYLLKAENALASMKANQGNTEWEISSAYYTMYFATYALLMKIGVKSEIHTCTIEFAKSYLKDHFKAEELETLSIAQGTRVDVQYYVGRNVNTKTQDKIKHMAADYLIKCRHLLPKIKEAELNKIREDITKRMK